MEAALCRWKYRIRQGKVSSFTAMHELSKNGGLEDALTGLSVQEAYEDLKITPTTITRYLGLERVFAPMVLVWSRSSNGQAKLNTACPQLHVATT